MADDPTVRAPVRRIKIKFGKKPVATHAVQVPGLLSSASQDSKETKPGSTLHIARLRQASLKGYIPPSATADAIVERLRDGEGFAPGAELPPWDFTAPPIISCKERPTKRIRQSPSREESYQQKCQAPAPSVPVGPTRREFPGAGPGRTEGGQEVKLKPSPKAEPTPERAAFIAVVSGESNSDQATNSQAYLPLSPDDAGHGIAREGSAVATGALQPHVRTIDHSSLNVTAMQMDSKPLKESRPVKSSMVKSPPLVTSAAVASALKAPHAIAPQIVTAPSIAAIAPHHSGLSMKDVMAPSPPRGSTARGDAPSTSGRHQPSIAPVAAQAGVPVSAQTEANAASQVATVPSGVSVETQTSHLDFPVLPVSFLELPRLCGTALSFQSIGPFDMQLEKERRSAVDGRSIDSLLEEAKRTKREGDQIFGQHNKAWTIKSLSKYVYSSLIFMEAADIIVHRRDQRYSHRYAADLYRQTAELLVHTVANADSIRGNGIGKEALRLLAERLCAVCLLRHTSLMAASFKACTDKAQIALREHHRQQQQQQLNGPGAGAAGVGLSCSGQQPSPEESSTSSHLAAPMASNGAVTTNTTTAGAASAAGCSTSFSTPQPLAGFGHEQLADLLNYARTTLRFSEYMKRSSKSFEAFLERPDVRQDQQAKLVCMHLAAVCMDVGMTPGMRVIHHAREAVRTLCDDLAR